VKPGVTPAEFWKTALSTASQKTITINGTPYTLRHIINPKALIGALK
jgi:hypothetical protein